MNELDLIGDESIVKEGFRVDSLDKAEWCLRTKARVEAEIERVQLYAIALKARIEKRVEEITKPHGNTIDAMDAFLRPWAEQEVARAKGKKSIKLIAGTIGFRQAPGRLEVRNEMAALAWLKEHGKQICITVKESVNKPAVKASIETDGEIPDGCELVPGEVRFYADPEPMELEAK